MGISQEQLASIRTVMEGFMPDTFANARTGKTGAVRVTAERATEHLQGLPHVVRVPRWRLKQPDGTDVAAADEGSVPGKGTFHILYVDDPASYTVEIVSHALRVRDAAGKLVLPTDQVVTLTNLTDKLTVSGVPALIYPAALDAEIRPVALRYEWAVCIDPATVYPDTTTTIQNGDMLTWPHLDRPTPLSEMRLVVSPIPLHCFYAKPVGDAQR